MIRRPTSPEGVLTRSVPPGAAPLPARAAASVVGTTSPGRGAAPPCGVPARRAADHGCASSTAVGVCAGKVRSGRTAATPGTAAMRAASPVSIRARSGRATETSSLSSPLPKVLCTLFWPATTIGVSA
ncbi:hypothetical protein OG948_42430 (plasmid) [Embleya sp. NBC_00888]|nr:hypothetical protein OG948_42430 [Embleya sp. NBC_00888]